MLLVRILVTLVLGSGLLVAAPAAAWDADYGRVWRGDGVLEPGCHLYRFRYRVRPGNDDWVAEFFLRGPGGEGLGTVAKDSDIHRKRGKGKYEVCHQSTRPGRFTIRGKLSIHGPDDHNPLTPPQGPTVKWVKPAKFRLSAPR
ncbi:hypothetical protein [Nocardioides coralli]|uniref:hypothetical protein n=1 Tax=Nocardioides coralli TaxID=2872154 RepID=UPI001CA39179|nr:hypothetical protein [Nocardioides coralli]QZY30319.1 hypothetical protein K6T13_06570 [Nocardioides coralli]